MLGGGFTIEIRGLTDLVDGMVVAGCGARAAGFAETASGVVEVVPNDRWRNLDFRDQAKKANDFNSADF